MIPNESFKLQSYSKKFEKSYEIYKKIVTISKTQAVYTINGCNKIASSNFAHDCKFLVLCYTIIIIIENSKKVPLF